jgi:hypothetical protein
LKHRFSSARFEEQRGSSRPDIVINDVAIEVKGPTNQRELETIAGKIVRYSRHYSAFIGVLFEIRTPEAHYRDWKQGILAFKFPIPVEIIEK